MAVWPTGTVTFLFTDIAGSTRLWEQYPQVMPGALARHDTLVCQAIEQHHGVVFHTAGDAFCAAFTRAPDALVAALAAQQMLVANDWQASGLPPGQVICVRMGLHTGTAEAHAGDYYGPPLNRVARILALAYGGQVLLSHATADLVRDHLPQNVTLRPLGEHPLKDLRQPEQIFQLIAPDLPDDFAPLHTAAAPQHQPAPLPLLATKLYLPSARTSLVSRTCTPCCATSSHWSPRQPALARPRCCANGSAPARSGAAQGRRSPGCH